MRLQAIVPVVSRTSVYPEVLPFPVVASRVLGFDDALEKTRLASLSLCELIIGAR